MKKILFFLILIVSVNAQLLKNTWEKIYGGRYEDGGNDIVYSKDDKNLFVIGYFDSKGEWNKDGWIMKLTKKGDVVWSKLIGGTYDDMPKRVIATRDNGLVFVGWSKSESDGNVWNGWIGKLSNSGDLEWQTIIPLDRWDGLNGVVQMSDDGYLAVGYTFSKGLGQEDIWLVRFDKFGNQLWDKTIGTSGFDRANQIIPTKDGNFIMVGYMQNKNNQDIMIMKIDKNGYVLWKKRFGKKGINEAKNVIQTKNGDFVIVGYVQTREKNQDLWIARVKKNGDLVWQKTLGGQYNEGANKVIETKNGDLIVVGWNQSLGAGFYSDAWILKFDKNGNKLFSTTYGGMEIDFASSILPYYDGYLFIGLTKSFGNGKTDLWIRKLDKNGNF